MSPNSYLERLATKAVIRELEKVNIDRSLNLLRERLDRYIDLAPSNGAGIIKHFPFGSYTRGTILPRKMDPQSDVDYMVVFGDSDLRPQSCLDRLRRFVKKNYEMSQLYQSHPTIILSLNHIQFELVPAVEGFANLKIPSKNSLFSEWMSTSPNEFNGPLTEKNKNNRNLIKPLIRLLKYWNACNNYPFESFALENFVVEHWTLSSVFGRPNLWTRFCNFMNELSPSTNQQMQTVARAQKLIAEVMELESIEQFEAAEKKLSRLLPEKS